MQTLIYSWSWDLPPDSQERIDIWLTKQFPYSRNFFHHIIERGGVSVNKKQIKKSHKLKEGDQVLIDDLSRYLSPVILDESPNIKIPVVLEKEDYLVINKPKWVLSHPNSVREVSQPSVVGFLYHNYKNLPTIWNFIRAWLLHRLDKDTDGLMIIAKTEKWLSHFKRLFQQKSESDHIQDKEAAPIKKFYRATCYITDEWRDFLSDISSQLPYYIQEIVIPKIPHYTPKLWITKILSFCAPLACPEVWREKELSALADWGFKKNKSVSLMKLNLEILTWRTHQIRYHLSTHWLPIVGDYLYWKEEEIPMQLTAYKLEFTDPDWDDVKLEI
jgi:23S rRNA pseudouridine1911/1915/1917 synthase